MACPHYLASEAGQEILRQGGNAIDAAIAANAALGVVYPHMTGLGGDAFWLIYEATSGRVYGLNGSGRSGRQVNRELYRQQGLESIPQRGLLAAITVPGAVDSWGQVHQRFGHLPWGDLLQPAIRLATEGYPVTASQARWTQVDALWLRQYGNGDNPFLPNAQVPRPGDDISNPALATTLERLARQGAAEFYQGETAWRLTEFLAASGGVLTPEDLAAHQSTWVEPISTTYRGYRVWELPPNSQGFTVLQMLNLIQPYNLQGMGHGSADYYHLLVEATKLAFADRDRWLTDPDFVKIPLTELISPTYADRRRARLSLTTAQSVQAGIIGGDTVYSAFVDSQGNAVSQIQSLYFDFGSAVVPPRLGFVLQNRGCFFSLDPQAANTLEPGKRCFHTLMPGLVQNLDGSPYLVFGTMGGEGQPQTQMALLTRVLDYGFDPQTAIDLPRWVWGRTWGQSSTGLTLEGRIPASVRQALTQRGHQVKVAPDWTDQMGHASLIQIDPQTQLLRGGCDPRSDGVTLGV